MTTNFEERHAWVALVMTPGMGPRRILRAVERCGCAARVLDLPLTELEGLGMPAQSAQFIAGGEAAHAADQELEKAAGTGAAVVTYGDEAYPARLREIFDPPALLWLRGDAALLMRPALAVVGTRHPTPYGTGIAAKLSRELAMRGLTILSGMARGVDTAAHKGALEAKRPTIAVWGTGVDVIYPKENKALAEQIVARGGAILSEYPLGTFPAPQNFPRRN
ncbi:MAG: DNA-processing protein DprA, partial [Acidobacteriaceae bacterium]